MNRITTGLLVLLMGAFVWAQRSPTSSQDQSQANQAQTTNDYGSRSVQGCLRGSSGNYTLKQDETGSTVKVSGDDAKLQGHVGQEVSIVGVVTNGSTAMTASDSADQPTIEVAQVTEIANSCGTGSVNSDLPR
jgi:hypothetical protein